MTKAKKEQEELDLEEKNNKAEESAVEETSGNEDKQEENSAEKQLKDLQEKMKEMDAQRKAEREAERARLEKLQRDRDEAVAKAAGSQNDAVTAKERELEAAKAAVDQSVAAFEDLYEKALEAGDSKQLREINTKLQKAIVQQSKIEEAQEQFSNWKKHQEVLAEQAKNQPKTQEVGQATKDWMARNPRFETDDDFKEEAVAAHHVALARGYQPDSKAYFQFIDKRLEKAFPAQQADEDEEGEEQPKAKKETVYAAAPARSSGGGESGEKKTYKLTKQEREIAAACNMTDLEYAKEKEKIAKGQR